MNYYLEKYRHCINQNELKSEMEKDINIASFMDAGLIPIIKDSANQVIKEKGYKEWNQ